LMKGKVKEAYEFGRDLEFRFTDNISVFDKVIPTLIPHKGETLCREGVYWFERARKMGIKTHFLRYIPPNQMQVRRVEIIPTDRITPSSRSFLIPLEFICRWYVAGSLFDRVAGGDLSAAEIGFASGHVIEYGEPLPEPLVEVSTKLERVDRLLDRGSALAISGLSSAEFDDIVEIVIEIDQDVARRVESRGLIHVDGKKEFAFDEDREPMVVDVYGTADEDRFWEKASYEEGQFVDLSKEYVRQYYRQSGYKDRLYLARENHKEDPAIPPLPGDVVEQTSRIYIKLYEMITGEVFASRA